MVEVAGQGLKQSGKMNNTALTRQLPSTQLRPLCSDQVPPNKVLELSVSKERDLLQDDCQLLHWSSRLEGNFEEVTIIRAFVKLVSLVVLLDAGEEYCIQDSIRGGVILAQAASEDSEEVDSPKYFRFIACGESQDIPTSFSVGTGKVSCTENTRKAMVESHPLSGLFH
jgi:ferricrocin synthase